MGRRLLLTLGMMLLALPAGSMAHAQGESRKVPSPEGAPDFPSGFPLPIPDDPKAPAPPEAGPALDEKPPAKSEKAPPRSPAKRSPDAAVQRTEGADPPQGRPAADTAPAPAETKPVPPRDPTPTPPPTVGSANAAGISGLSADRLPLGKQSVAVTVDVQAPPSMNLYQPTTLRLVIRNTGANEAMNVQVFDDLPDGLRYLDSQPKAYLPRESLLSWRFGVLPGGSEKIITIKVKPEKTGPYDHAATVTFQTGSKARTLVHRPRLKVDQTVSTPKVLKNQPVEFKVVVTNIGDGPARNVTIQAKLSPGLRHGSGERGDEGLSTDPIPELAPGQHQELDPLVVDAIQGDEQSCTITASSPDVILASPEDKAEAENTKTVTVVEPKLKLTLTGPDKRYTDTVAPYEITVENPGTAPARRVRIVATLPVSGRLIAVPRNAEYDSATRRLQWAVDSVEPGGKLLTFGFEVRMGGLGFYEVTAEARGEGALHATARKSTDVIGMADIDLVVSERQRVVDVGGKTTFQIRLRNYGTKDATRLQVTARLSKNLDVTGYAGPIDQDAQKNADGQFIFPLIDKLGPGKEMLLGIDVKVVGDEPKLATCRVQVLHDDLTEPFEDMAGIKVMTSPRAAASGP